MCFSGCPAESSTGECERMIGPCRRETDATMYDATVTAEEKKMLLGPSPELSPDYLRDGENADSPALVGG